MRPSLCFGVASVSLTYLNNILMLMLSPCENQPLCLAAIKREKVNKLFRFGNGQKECQTPEADVCGEEDNYTTTLKKDCVGGYRQTGFFKFDLYKNLQNSFGTYRTCNNHRVQIMTNENNRSSIVIQMRINFVCITRTTS